MTITFTLSLKKMTRCDLFVLPISDDTAKTATAHLDKETSQTIKHVLKTSLKTPSVLGTSFLSRVGSSTILYTPSSPSLNHLLINVGFKMANKTVTKETDWRAMGGTVGHALHHYRPRSVTIDVSSLTCSPDVIQQWVEGVLLGAYRFTDYKTKKNPLPKIDVTLLVKNISPPLREALSTGEWFAHATNRARDWATMPANDLNPETFVTIAKKVLKGSGVSVSVIDGTAAKKRGMNALLGVGKGSSIPPRLLVMKYNIKQNNKQKNRPIALVGKGVTFDTGGISLKPSKGMSDMKADMSGAAAVLSTMVALGQFKPKLPVLGLIPLAENMPGGLAQRPGDVVTAMNGKTIEILNTDAEGRLILADALCYAVEEGASKIVDIATLTGACGVALGELAMGLLSNSDSEVAAMKGAAEKTGERVWQLPLYAEYLEYLESGIADIAHCSEGRYGGTCTAAKFLEQFVNDTPWIHLDIASVMIQKKNKGAQVKGMSGAGARNLIQYVLDQV